MSLKKEKYLERLIDPKIEKYLNIWSSFYRGA